MLFDIFHCELAPPQKKINTERVHAAFHKVGAMGTQRTPKLFRRPPKTVPISTKLNYF
jgi:hypothetical protein